MPYVPGDETTLSALGTADGVGTVTLLYTGAQPAVTGVRSLRIERLDTCSALRSIAAAASAPYIALACDVPILPIPITPIFIITFLPTSLFALEKVYHTFLYFDR